MFTHSIYLHKDISDLRVGDKVLFLKEYIDKKLEEIEPRLMKSERYRAAKEKLYVEGQTKFRYDLVKAVGGHFDDLEAKLFKKGTDFSDDEYSHMIDDIQELLQKDERTNHKYARSTIKDWLTGDTLAPRDWEVFNVLATLNPSFKSYNLSRAKGGLKEDYKLFTVLRQSIMRYLTTKGGTISIPRSQKVSKETISATPEINLVMEEFIEDVNKKYALAYVTGTKEIFNVPKKIRQRPNIRLSKGIVIGDVSDFEHSITDFETLYNDHNILNHALSFIFEKYLSEDENNEFTAKIKEDKVRGIWPVIPDSYWQARFLTQYLLWAFNFTSSLHRLRYDAFKDIFFEPTMRVYKKLLDSTIDRHVGLQESQSLLAYQTFVKVIRAVPKEIFSFAGQIRKQKSMRNIYKKAAEIRKRYGVDPTTARITLADYVDWYFLQKPNLREYHMRKAGTIIRDPKEMQNYFELYQKSENKHPLLGRKDFVNTLSKYNMEFLWKFIPETIFPERYNK